MAHITESRLDSGLSSQVNDRCCSLCARERILARTVVCVRLKLQSRGQADGQTKEEGLKTLQPPSRRVTPSMTAARITSLSEEDLPP